MEINFKRSEKAPYRRDQVMFRAKIIDTKPEGSGYTQDVIDINGNGRADTLKFKSAGCARLEVVEPTLHAGTDAGGSRVGMSHLREIAGETGQRYFDHDQVGSWSTYRETISGGTGTSMHTWKPLSELAKDLCPEYRYQAGPQVAIDLKRCELVIYNPKP